MIRFVKILFALLPIIACGCLETSRDIVVNKDGGGKIVERFMISKAAFGKMAGLFPVFSTAEGAKSKKPSLMDVYDQKKLMADAASYGPGVKYVSSKQLDTASKGGYEVEYSFDNINNLHINQNPSDKGPGAAASQSKTEEENITFMFEKGSPATLTVIFPKQTNVAKAKEEKTSKKDKASEQKALDEMRDVLKDFYIGITVRPAGKIVETNATYNEGGKITLLEMDFNKLLSDEKQFQAFAQSDPQTIEESKALLKKMPGFKVELNPKVVIKFE